MYYIAHRVNTIEDLKLLPNEYGVELDLRDYGDRLVLEHDPFTDGEDFEEYLKYYGDHGTMILNIKSERIEHRALDLVKKYNVRDYFFLDSTFPMINLLSGMGETKIALRFSELEGLDNIRTMAGKVEWVWVDCFSTLPINYEIFQELKSLDYKICLVSPELQGREKDILTYKNQLKEQNIVVDAICTKYKNINLWRD